MGEEIFTTTNTLSYRFHSILFRKGLILLRIILVVAVAALIFTVSSLDDLLENWWLPLIGIAGALVANSTGIGGGVIFVPAFDKIGLPDAEIIGTSLLIQAFGMTMGALTYLSCRTSDVKNPTSVYFSIIFLALFSSLAGALFATLGGFRPDLPIQTIYKIISIFLVTLIIVASLTHRQSNGVFQVLLDAPLLMILGLIGGLFVGWTSIGVGELIGIYLLLRGFRPIDAIGVAVIVTALTVLGLHIAHLPNLLLWNQQIGLFVVIGALPGAFLAPRLLYIVGAKRMKAFCAVWIILSVLMT